MVEVEHHLVDAGDEVVLGAEPRRGRFRRVGRGVLEVRGDEHRALRLRHDVRQGEAEHAVVVLVPPRRAEVVIGCCVVAVPRRVRLQRGLLVVEPGLVDVGVHARARGFGQDVVKVPENAGEDPRGDSYHYRLV